MEKVVASSNRLRSADRGTRPPALLAEQGEGLLAKAHRNVEHRTETNRTLAAAQSEQPKIEQTGVELVALFAARQIKREHQSSAPPSRRRPAPFYRTRASPATLRNVRSTSSVR